MAKDFATGSDVSSDVGSDTGNDVARSDFGGELAGDNGVDLNASDAMQSDTEKQPYKPSALSNILTAGAEGARSPSDLAQATGALRAPPGAEDVYAQGLQAGWNMGVVGSGEYMDATIRQHGRSPSAELEAMQIQQSIDAASEYQGEPLRDNEDYYDENGVMITDEKLRE